MNTKYVLVGGGIVLPYMETGNAEGTPVIFLHGVTDSHRSFELVFPHLSPELRSIALTQRGHGDAPRLEGPYTPRVLADDLNAFMDALGIGAAYIVGHSMGGPVSLRAAAQSAGRVMGIVAVDTLHDAEFRFPEEQMGGFIAAFEADYPKTNADMVTERWQGKIAMNKPQSSSGLSQGVGVLLENGVVEGPECHGRLLRSASPYGRRCRSSGSRSPTRCRTRTGRGRARRRSSGFAAGPRWTMRDCG